MGLCASLTTEEKREVVEEKEQPRRRRSSHAGTGGKRRPRYVEETIGITNKKRAGPSSVVHHHIPVSSTNNTNTDNNTDNNNTSPTTEPTTEPKDNFRGQVKHNQDDGMDYLMQAVQEHAELDDVIQTGIHCDGCVECPIIGPVFVYDDPKLTTLCKNCNNDENNFRSLTVMFSYTNTKCTSLTETLPCLLKNSGLLSKSGHLSERNFIEFWKIKYPDMPDYQVNALVASVNIEKGLQDINSETFLQLWLSLSSDESTSMEDITHRQLECHNHASCNQPFGAAPILGYAYVSLDKDGILQSYCEECFRAEEKHKHKHKQNQMYERCRTEQESMSASFRLGAAKSKKSADDWLKEMGNGVVNNISIEAFGKLHGFIESMSDMELNGLCDCMHMRAGTKNMDFVQFCTGSVMLAGAHETPTLNYTKMLSKSNLVEIGARKKSRVATKDVELEMSNNKDLQHTKQPSRSPRNLQNQTDRTQKHENERKRDEKVKAAFDKKNKTGRKRRISLINRKIEKKSSDEDDGFV